jgi:hypothetical protein
VPTLGGGCADGHDANTGDDPKSYSVTMGLALTGRS